MSHNKISINEYTHYHTVVESSYARPRSIIKASGTCNNKDFGALLICDPGINSIAYLYQNKDIEFNTSEYQSIRRKLKSLTESNAIDSSNIFVPDNFESFEEYLFYYMEKSYYGDKIFLQVSFKDKDKDKDKVKSLGAQWDNAKRQWYFYNKLHQFSTFKKWL